MAVTKTPTNYTLVFTSGFLAAYVLLVSHQSISSYMPSIDSVFSTATIASISSVLTSSSSTTDVDVEDQYRRALEESLGYFDDIPESKWMRRKDITLSYDHTEVVPPEGADDYNPNWYYKNWHPDFHCEFEDFVGDGGDGGKWICDPHRLLKKKDCLVYSVGSNGKFDFEQHVQMALPHCEIHIFDFTDYTSAMKAWGGSGVNASFHAWGLGSKDGAMNIKVSPGQKRPTFKSFRETVNELGHVGRSIDLFKIDCEGCEWISYLDWFNDPGILGMRQILVETHRAPKGTAQEFFQYLHDKGYVIFHKEPNIQYGGGNCIEFGFLQLNQTFFSDTTAIDRL